MLRARSDRGSDPGGARPGRRVNLARDGWWMAAVGAGSLLAVASLRMELLDWGAVGIMTALGLATGVFAFRIDDESYASFGSAVFAASAVLFGGFAAVWVVALSTAILGGISLRQGFRRTVEDVGTQVIAIFLASVVYLAIGGKVFPTHVGVAHAARFTCLFASFGLLTAMLRSITSGGVKAALLRYGRWIAGKGVVIELAMLPLGLLLVVAYTPGEPATFPLLAVVLMVSGAAGKSLWDTRRSLAASIEELRSMNALGRDLSSTLRLDVLVELIDEHARDLLGASAMCLALYDEQTGEMDSRACFGGDGQVVSWRSQLDGSLTSWVVKHRSPLLVPDLASGEETRKLDPRLATDMEERGFPATAWLGVPLVAGERFMGVLSACGSSNRPFAQPQVDLLANIGGQIARAAENARLYEGLEQSNATIEQWSRTLEDRVEERTSELEQARRELQELNDSLEQRVEERTRELRNVQEKIVQSGRLAAVGELAAGVAHELNNPLGGILGYLQYDIERLRSRRDAGLSIDETAKLDEHLCQMERQAQRCRSIVQNLLRFSRESENSFAAVDVNETLRQTLDFTEKQLAMRGIELGTSLSDRLPPVVGDAQQLQQVFANIILNARNAMPSGGRLNIESSASERGGVTVSFSDTGKGIRKEYLGRVFEPFFTTREVGQGTGLGLSVSYGIVKDHGGEINVESEVGLGSTFTISLPSSDFAKGLESPDAPRRSSIADA